MRYMMVGFKKNCSLGFLCMQIWERNPSSFSPKEERKRKNCKARQKYWACINFTRWPRGLFQLVLILSYFRHAFSITKHFEVKKTFLSHFWNFMRLGHKMLHGHIVASGNAKKEAPNCCQRKWGEPLLVAEEKNGKFWTPCNVYISMSLPLQSGTIYTDF